MWQKMASQSRTARQARRLLAERRGAIMAEYVILLSTVCIAFTMAIVAFGPALVANFEMSQGILLSPFP